MPISFDETSPGFVVTVIAVRPEQRVVGRQDPATLGKVLDRMTDVTERVLSFTYEDSEEEFDVLRLTVDNHDLLFLRHPAWSKGNLVRFFFGYPGRIFGPRYAVVDSVRGFLTLEITCVEQTSMSNEAKQRIFKNLTRAEVVKKLVNEGSFPGVTSVDIDESSLAQEKSRDWQQARQSDWQFVQRLAEKPGYEVFVEGNTLHFHKRKIGSEPIKRYEYFYGVGDLISFDIEEYRITDRAAEVEVKGFDPLERKVLGATGSNASTKRDTLGNQGNLVITRSRSTGDLVAGKRIVPSPETDKATVAQEADAHYRKSEEGEVQASAIVIGDPKLKAKSVIEILGIEHLSGKWYVSKNVHEISGGGYVSRLSLLKNALTNTPSSEKPSLDPSSANENRERLSDSRRKKIVRDPITGDLRQE